jgi:transposase
MARTRSRTGKAISPRRKTRKELKRLHELLAKSKAANDLATWGRAKAVLGYIAGRKAVDLAEEVGVTRGAVNRWLRWYEAMGAEGLRTGKAPGSPPRLSSEQRSELAALVDAGPLAAGYSSGVWTGPMIGNLIEQHFGVRYHNHYIPVLLHDLGFSVQRPRKRLARADADAQATWVRTTFPAIKKKPRHAAA